ncbi:integrin alpha-M-like isoform X2 [Mustelus asterias]
MVVITDGKSNDRGTNFNEAIALAEAKDILRFAVGVGPDFQTEDGQRELRTIASNSTNDTVFSIKNFEALKTIQEKLQAKIFAIEGTQGMLNMTSFQHEMSQEGFSSILTSDAVVLGTVGAYGWSGGLLLYQGAQETFINISRTDKEIWNSYLGYSVQEASGADVVYYLVGAPRYRHRGEVVVFQKGSNGSWEDVQRIPGEQIGSYFGSEICTLDVTGDGQTDLVLIGAPLYRGQGFGGKVIICTMTPRGNFSCRDSLRGEEGYELGRFGSAIVGLRDLNGDGLSDVAIGAPLEDDHHGSVYIYHGRRTGIHPTYSQRIKGANYSPALRYFGHSISGVMDVSGDSLTDLIVGALGTVTVLRSRPVLNVSVTILFNPWQIPFEAYQCQPAKLSNQPFGNTTACFRMRRLVSDNWGVLKANITYSLLLDAGRKQGRAVFKTLSRSMTTSLLLLTGEKRCQQFPILLPSCVKDYLEPIDLSLKFTLAGEVITGSKGLCPILNENKETSERYKLPFQKDCGLDSECVDYLRVVFNFSGGDLAVIGRDTVLILTVVLENAHEDSSHTQLNFLHPSQLSFKKISNVQPSSDQVACSDLPTDQRTERGNLSCAVNHPVFRKASRVTLNAEFDISKSEREEKTINFTITASSGNSLRITNESSLTQNLSLRYAVNIATSGIEYTRHVNLAGREDLQLVKHSYQVENMGPRSLPIHVKVTVPVRIGTHSLWNVTVSERHPGNHSVCHPPAHRLAVVQSETLKLPQDYVRLDCGIALCLEMLCEMAVLEKHSSVIFDIQGELMSAALTELNVNKLLLFSKVSLSYDEDKYVDISEDGAHFREATIITEVDILKAVNRLGMIVGGSIGGLVLLIIIIIVFYKLGFFKRNGKSGEGDILQPSASNGGEGPSTE